MLISLCLCSVIFSTILRLLHNLVLEIFTDKCPELVDIGPTSQLQRGRYMYNVRSTNRHVS